MTWLMLSRREGARMSDFDRGFIAGLIFGAAAVWLVWLVVVW